MLRKIRKVGRTEGFVVGAIIGAATAAAASLLFAPKSGKDLRKDISEGTNKTLENVDGYFDTAKKRGTGIVEDVEKSASSYLSVAGEKTDEALSKAKALFNKKAKEAEELVEDVVEDEPKYKYNYNGKKYNTYQFKR